MEFNCKLPSSLATANSCIVASPCYYFGFVAVTGGATNNTMTLYDSTSTATGTAIEGPWVIDATKTMDGHEHSVPVKCDSGIFVHSTWNGTSPSVRAYYQKLPQVK